MKTAIIGGGITGLSALYELEKHGIDAIYLRHQNNLEVRFAPIGGTDLSLSEERIRFSHENQSSWTS